MARILTILHAREEHLGSLEPLLRERGHALDVRAMPDRVPVSPEAEDCSGLIVMGGSMSAYDGARHPFLQDEQQLIREALRGGDPVLGICLGSQLLAAAGGARVFAGAQVEVGWFPVELVGRDHWLEGWPDVFEPFHWHGDTFDLPVGATLLASSAAYPHQAFRLGSGLGLQFHVEATAEMVRDWSSAPDLGERWRPPAAHVERAESAAAAMAPLVASLATAFGRAAEQAARRG
jgi:GMP synthase (glutamine-hydrolysing)